MSGSRADIPELDALRAEFDRTFAEPLPEPDRDLVRIIVLRAGGTSYGVMLAHVVGVDRLGHLAPIPLHDPALLGVAAAQIDLVPVYCLARLLSPGQVPGKPAISVRIRHPRPLAVAVDAFQGHHVVSGTRMTRLPAAANAQAPIIGHVNLPGLHLPLLDLAIIAGCLDRGAVSISP